MRRPVISDGRASGHTGIATDASQRLFLQEELEDLLRARAVVLDLDRVAARGRIAERVDLRARASLAYFARLEPEVAERDRLLRLLLRAHDPLQRRVARLVDRVRDRDDGRERRLDHV